MDVAIGAMIQLDAVEKTYRMGDAVVRALHGVSLTIESGEFVAITGPSGSGKSTLMHVIGLLDVPDSGSYRLHGRNVSGLSDDELAIARREQIGFIFQQFHLLPRTTAAENVSMPLLYSRHRTDLPGARALLARVGLGERAEHRPNELSGGQQQRVAIARALVNKPALLLADEPTGNLDTRTRDEMMELLRQLNREGITVILVTHEPEIARMAPRCIRMRDGQIESDDVQHAAHKIDATSSQVASPGAPRTGKAEWFEHVRQGIRALAGNKVRTALSVLGILIGVAAVVAVLAVGRGAKEAIESQMSSLGSNLLVLRSGAVRVAGVAQETGATTRLRSDDAAALREQVAGIRAISPTVSGRVRAAFGNRNWNTQLQGTDVSYARMRASEPTIGRFFNEEENRFRARVAVVGMTLVRELFGGENPVGHTLKLNKINFLVVGVLPEKGATSWRDQDDVVLVPVLTAMHRVLGKDYVDTIDIEVEDAQYLERVQDSVKETMSLRHRIAPAQREEAFQIRNMADIQAAMQESNRTMSVLLSTIAAISLLVGGIGIMNIMLVSVTERTREIGLRKAVGARARDILAQFLIESVVVSALGGIVGVLLGGAVAVIMSTALGWNMVVTPSSVVLAFAFSATIGIVFGIYPARRAAALNPIEALRYE